jgi:tRNA(fMet)-specific endonuclease VapC
MIYLLDTNVWIAILRKKLRQKYPQVAARYHAANRADIWVASVVVAELRFGCVKSAQPAASRAKLDALLAPVTSIAFDDDAADFFAPLRFHLESLGTPIGPYDTQIAALALAHGCTLVTNNTSEFSRVPALTLEDWQVP